jgi:hypothetical protein
MFPLHSNYRRDGATRPLFRSRISMMASCPPRAADTDEESSATTVAAAATSPAKRSIHIKTTATFHRPRPRMWSSTGPSVSNDCGDTDGYYSSSSSDSESEDEAEECSYDDYDTLCDGSTSRKNDPHGTKKKRRPISPTSCAAFDDHGRLPKRRRTTRRHRTSSGSGRRVTFARDPVADVRYRPRTPPEEKRSLFYSKRDISGFRSAYYDWLDEGHQPSDLFELDEAEEAPTATAPTASPPKKSTPTASCVTPDNSSEEENDDHDECGDYEEED